MRPPKLIFKMGSKLSKIAFKPTIVHLSLNIKVK